MASTYNQGDRVRCTGTLETTAGVDTDPTVARAWYRSPVGTLTTLTYGDTILLKSATGIYYFDLDVDASGTWHYGFYSTGTGKAASDDVTIIVKASRR